MYFKSRQFYIFLSTYLGAVYSETCVFDTRFMRHYNVCYKMMEKGREKKHPTSFFPSPSFYNIHCSDAWNACQTHTFHCRQGLNATHQNIGCYGLKIPPKSGPWSKMPSEALACPEMLS